MKKLFIDLQKEIYKLWENNLELSNYLKRLILKNY